jgi:14-3-3 protein epsilon
MDLQQRDDNIYMAKLAEQAERYDEMVDYMKLVSHIFCQIRLRRHTLVL